MMTEIQDNHLESSIHTDLVKMLLTLVTAPTTQELLFAIQENPNFIEQLNTDEIRLYIVESLYQKEKQLCVKQFLGTIKKLEKAIKDTIRIHDEFSNASSAFSHYLSPEKSVPTIMDGTVGDVSFQKISDLIQTSDSLEKLQNKLNTIATFSHFLLSDVLEYSSKALEDISITLHEQQLQYKICKDFFALDEREKKLLSQGVLNEYAHNSTLLSKTLETKNIGNCIFLHKNVLHSLIQSYQLDKPLGDILYYFSGVENNTIHVPFDPFRGMDVLNKNLKHEIFQFLAMHDFLLKPENKGEKEEKDRLIEERGSLIAKLKDPIDTILSNPQFEICDLFDDKSEKRNLPVNHLTNTKGLAIPVTLSGIDDTYKQKVFQSLAFDLNMNDEEKENWLIHGEIPKWFDVGYLVPGSTITKKDKTFAINTHQSSDVYPVLIYHGTVAIFYNSKELNSLTKPPFLQAIPGPEHNVSTIQDTTLVDTLGEYIYNMYHHSPNIYKKDIIKGISSKERNKFK